MRVWIDLFSGDEMVSDSYPHKLIYDDACLEIQAKFTTKGSDFVAIAADDEPDANDGGETVINVVDAHKLIEMTLAKKDVMSMIKVYLKKVVDKLKASGKEDRVAGFQKGATELVKFVMGKYDEMQIFVGESGDVENGGLCFAYTKDGETEPTFLFFNDGMRCEKF